MKYFVIGDEDTVLGFGMAGVDGRSVVSRSDAESAFQAALAAADVGIIAVTEAVADLIRPRIDDYLFSRQFPLIVEIPGAGGRDPQRPGLRRLVDDAIGVRL